VFVLTISF